MINKFGIGKACAKMILTGEHTVLYGSGAIAVPVLNRYFQCKAQINTQNKILTYQQNIKKTITESENKSLYRLITATLSRLGKSDGLTLSFFSQIQNRSGMGSSAAMAVATVRAIYDLYNTPLQVEELIELAMIAEEIIHGKSSGIDVNVIARNEVIYYKVINNKAYIEPLNIKHSLSFILTNTKKSSVTAKAVAKVSEQYKENPQLLKNKIDRVDEIASQIKAMLVSTEKINYFELNKLFNENHQILVTLGLGSETEVNIKALINKITTNYGYKITGAGIGGYNLIFCDVKLYEKIRENLDLAGYKTVQVTIPRKSYAKAHPNIALIKYWGKRNNRLILPHTSSLSMTLEGFETETTVSYCVQDEIIINSKNVVDSKIISFLNYFRNTYNINRYFKIDTKNNFPTAAGLASSSSGFAALAAALAKLTNLKLSTRQLSLLARHGSGSACRSIEGGINLWHAGEYFDGSDSYATQQYQNLPWNISVLAIVVNSKQKSVSSREGMQKTVNESPFYEGWKKIVERDLTEIMFAIDTSNYQKFGEVLERNAIAMHATLAGTTSPESYLKNESYEVIEKINKLREQKIYCYWTADAGPNIKIICLKEDTKKIKQYLANYQIYELTIANKGISYE